MFGGLKVPPPPTFLERYDSKRFRGWGSANDMIPLGLGGKRQGDFNTEFTENREICWRGRRPSWIVEFKGHSSAVVKACQG